METPDLNHIAERSPWSLPLWIAAWDSIRIEFPEHKIEAAWTEVRNISDRLGYSPVSAAQALVRMAFE